MITRSEVLQIMNSNLNAERNESIGKFTHEGKTKCEGFLSRKEEVDVSKNSADGNVTQDYRHATNFNFDNTKPEDREHVQIFEKIYNLFATYAQYVGIEMVHDWKTEKSIMFFVANFLVVFTWLCILYTQCIHINNGEILRVLEACAIYGVASSCAQKVLGYLHKRHLILWLFFSIRKMCRQIISGNQAVILKSDLQKTLKFLKMFAVGVASNVVLFVACPIKSYIVDKELMSLLPIEIVFVDQSTFVGFAIANVVMTIMRIFAALGTVLYGAVFIYAIRMYSLQMNLIGQDFQDLDEMWADGSIVPLRHKQLFLLNICNKQQDIKNYMSTIRDIFERKFFFYFGLNYFSQIICLFEVTKNQWTPGYAIAMALFIEMMFYCVMGSQIAIADDRLCASIYAADWYRYDLSSQNIIMLLLNRCQQLNQLRLGPLGPLSVVTGIKVVKSIYTYYTVLTELL